MAQKRSLCDELHTSTALDVFDVSAVEVVSIAKQTKRKNCGLAHPFVFTSIATATEVLRDLNCNAQFQTNRQTLAEYWARSGFPYTATMASETPQVLVHFRSAQECNDAQRAQRTFSYPADKVFRLNSPATISQCELESYGATRTTATETPNLVWGQHRVKFQMRDLFIAAPGYVLLSADFSQIEMRIVAHFAMGRNILAAFGNKQDVFITMARRIQQLGNATTSCRITAKQRKLAKEVCYSILYGSGDAAIAKKLGRSLGEAKSIKKAFGDAFPSILKFRHKVVNDCRENGYVESLMCRKRYFPSINSANVRFCFVKYSLDSFTLLITLVLFIATGRSRSVSRRSVKRSTLSAKHRRRIL